MNIGIAQLYCLKIKKESSRRRKEDEGRYKIPKGVWTGEKYGGEPINRSTKKETLFRVRFLDFE